MNKIIPVSTRLQSVSLFLTTGYLIVLLLASGHKVDFKDYAQVKLLLELPIFGLAGVILLINIRKLSSIFLVSLLGLVQLSLIDILMAIFSVDYGDEVPFVPLALFAVIFLNNAFLIYAAIKNGGAASNNG